MPLPNKIIIASAGSGKTTSIVTEAGDHGQKSALITFTNKNTAELREKAHSIFGHVPASMTVSTWYRFLLRHFIRPYQCHLYQPKVRTLKRVEGRSAKYVKKDDINRHYFSSDGDMYMDKASQFACAVIEKSKGLPLQRIARIYDHIYIDEVQDLAGYDLDLIEHLLNANVRVTLVGDVRQATYRTNPGAKNAKFAGPKIVAKFEEWCKQDCTNIEYQSHSHRCVQSICDFADSFYPDLPSTKSLNENETGHDGVFAVREADVDHYLERFDAQSLRLKRTKSILPGCPLNYGESKGMGFDRVLLFPHAKFLKVLKTGDVNELGESSETRAKVYVGITRAHQSVGIVVPNNFKPANIPIFDLGIA